MPIVNADIAEVYAAGLFDGEGSVRLHSNIINGHRYYRPCVQVTNTTIALLHYLRDSFGGSVCKSGSPVKETHKQCWRWECRSKLAVAFLHRVLPYMREPDKVRRAKLLMKFAAATTAEREKIIARFFVGSTVVTLHKV